MSAGARRGVIVSAGPRRRAGRRARGRSAPRRRARRAALDDADLMAMQRLARVGVDGGRAHDAPSRDERDLGGGVRVAHDARPAREQRREVDRRGVALAAAGQVAARSPAASLGQRRRLGSRSPARRRRRAAARVALGRGQRAREHVDHRRARHRERDQRGDQQRAAEVAADGRRAIRSAGARTAPAGDGRSPAGDLIAAGPPRAWRGRCRRPARRRAGRRRGRPRRRGAPRG